MRADGPGRARVATLPHHSLTEERGGAARRGGESERGEERRGLERRAREERGRGTRERGWHVHGCRYDIEAETAVRAMEAGMGLDMKLDKAATSIISPSNISPLLQVRANCSSATVSRRIESSIGRGRLSTRCNAEHALQRRTPCLQRTACCLQRSPACCNTAQPRRMLCRMLCTVALGHRRQHLRSVGTCDLSGTRMCRCCNILCTLHAAMETWGRARRSVTTS